MRSKVWSNMCRFRMIVDLIQNSTDSSTKNSIKPSNDQKLKFYGLFKQATVGKCSGKAPSRLKVIPRMKYFAWKELGNMSKDQAKKNYVELAYKVDPKLSAKL
ncbi:unnamed protein product [Moneuplotes crassus]|uniref:ACB domain-containing protein n=1 Tax=Euplotes crassus TaxID=5936 RepID=A0AAD1XTP0_EUPCR|nr:unnamed protein product [Moneuplotes crassus]